MAINSFPSQWIDPDGAPVGISALPVEVFVEDTWLVVRNTYQPKDSRQESTGIGQQNLRKRLSYLSLNEPIFLQEGEFYVAKIPLLKDKS
jgi:hypothetical protein